MKSKLLLSAALFCVISTYGQFSPFTKIARFPIEDVYRHTDRREKRKAQEFENRKKQADYNLEYLRELNKWVQDLRSKQTDTQFANSMDYCLTYLNGLYNKDLSTILSALTGAEGYINEEIDKYNKRIEEVNNPNIYWEKGLEYLKNNEVDNAIREFQIVQHLAPDFNGVNYILGYIYFDRKDYNTALSYLNKFIQNNPDKLTLEDQDWTKYYLTLEYRGWTKYYLNDHYGALIDFNQQVELDPSNPIAYYNRGSAKSELNDNHGAIVDYEKSIELEPSFSMAYNNLGWSKYELKDYKSALKYLDIAIEKDSNNNIAWGSRAETKFMLDDYKGCIYDCTRALWINKEMANMYLLRGRARYRTGKTKDACLDWSDAGQYGEKEAYEYISKYCQ